ncbi:MAG: ornithine cyclodeaminase family protein [Burkholderiales bacterium]|nr:ornithine cyclodeaminase family protein [Burkholderiales bacterium]
MMLLNDAALRTALDMPTCIAALERAFIDAESGYALSPMRTRVRAEKHSPATLTLMPAARGGAAPRWALKEMVVNPAERKAGRDSLQGAVLLHDGVSGRLLAVADASGLTAIRTAAASALATRTLARANAREVVLIGTGIQARLHVEAMRTVLPQARVRAWGRDEAKARAFAERHRVELAPSLEAAVREADVVCTLTSSQAPFVRREWIRSGCHVNAVGSSRRTHAELLPETVAAASLFVDGRDAALAEAGDVVQAVAACAIAPSHVQAELGEVLAGRHPGRRSAGEFTLFKSLGNGMQDLAAIEAAVQAARSQGLGVEVEW